MRTEQVEEAMTAAIVQSILNRYLQKYLKNVKTGEWIALHS